MNIFLILIGKLISKLFRATKLGHGSTWPGHIALSVNKHFISDLLKENHLKVIVVAGTNGKTTTAKLIRTILETNGKTVIQNHSGANLLNGIASSLLLHADNNGHLKADYALFETDENTLPLLLKITSPDHIVLLNLFRDQLDRYGEVNSIASKWRKSIEVLPDRTKLILNADDPLIAYLGLEHQKRKDSKQNQISYFSCINVSLFGHSLDHAVDSVYCPRCGEKLTYSRIVFSHLGAWECTSCHLKRPEVTKVKNPNSTLLGAYNQYNIAAAVCVARDENVKDETIQIALAGFQPAFGRQEVIEKSGKKIQLFLSKNPTGFNESLRTITNMQAKHALIVLNDRIPDGQDISWIWDVDFEKFVKQFASITLSGDRCFDLALRVKYAGGKADVYERVEDAITKAHNKTPRDQTLYVLPTYSAMLEIRKILTGKQIL